MKVSLQTGAERRPGLVDVGRLLGRGSVCAVVATTASFATKPGDERRRGVPVVEPGRGEARGDRPGHPPNTLSDGATCPKAAGAPGAPGSTERSHTTVTVATMIPLAVRRKERSFCQVWGPITRSVGRR